MDRIEIELLKSMDAKLGKILKLLGGETVKEYEKGVDYYTTRMKLEKYQPKNKALARFMERE